MIEQGTVDFTVNVKSTQSILPHTTYIEPSFTTIKLNVYTHPNEQPLRIAGIRGFDYLGHRQALVNQSYTFSEGS